MAIDIILTKTLAIFIDFYRMWLIHQRKVKLSEECKNYSAIKDNEKSKVRSLKRCWLMFNIYFILECTMGHNI